MPNSTSLDLGFSAEPKLQAIQKLTDLLNSSENCRIVISKRMLTEYSLELDAFVASVDEESGTIVVTSSCEGESYTDTLDPLCVALLLATNFDAIDSASNKEDENDK